MKKSSKGVTKCLPKNVGVLDRIVRVVVGVLIIGWGVSNQSYWGLIGLLPLFTGVSGMCCLYTTLGINTNK